MLPGQAYNIWEKYVEVIGRIDNAKIDYTMGINIFELMDKINDNWPAEPFLVRLTPLMLLRLLSGLYSGVYRTASLIFHEERRLLFQRLVALSTDSDIKLLIERGLRESDDITLESKDSDEEKEWRSRFSNEIIPDIGRILQVIYGEDIVPLFYREAREEKRLGLVKFIEPNLTRFRRYTQG